MLLTEVQERVGHQFRDPALLLQALTHSSFSNENASDEALAPFLRDNERLEFLGDAVIGLVVANGLMEKFAGASEGKLSRWRSHLVSRKTLAEIAADCGMGNWVLLGRGEQRTGGAEKRSILAGVFEAIVGAIYLDAGIDKAAAFLLDIYRSWFEGLEEGKDQRSLMMDMKTHLQERTQLLYRSTPVYRLVDAWGLEHEKHFRVEIEIQGKVVSQGDGRSKKEAEQHAAHQALEILGF